jgi:two-component system, NtrC family, response regulator HydG
MTSPKTRAQCRWALPSADDATPGGGVPANHLIGRPLAEVERYYSERALELTAGNREEAAKMLGIGERTLYRNIKEWKKLDDEK